VQGMGHDLPVPVIARIAERVARHVHSSGG
jgi:hypothetical protein